MLRIKAQYTAKKVELTLEGDVSEIIKYLEAHEYQNFEKLREQAQVSADKARAQLEKLKTEEKKLRSQPDNEDDNLNQSLQENLSAQKQIREVAVRVCSCSIPLHAIAYRTYQNDGNRVLIQFNCDISDCFYTDRVSNLVAKLHAPLSWYDPDHVIPNATPEQFLKNESIFPWTEIDDRCAIGIIKVLENIGKSFSDFSKKTELTFTKNMTANNGNRFLGNDGSSVANLPFPQGFLRK
jgi:hypothetical protein